MNRRCNFALFVHNAAYSHMQTMYLVLVERSGAEDGLSSLEIMFYNSFLSLPFLMFLIIATGEFPKSLSLLFAQVRMLIWFLVFGLIHDYARMNWIFGHLSVYVYNKIKFNYFTWNNQINSIISQGTGKCLGDSYS